MSPQFDIVDLSEQPVPLKPRAIDYAALVGKYVVISTRHSSNVVNWSGAGLVVRVADYEDGVTIDFDYGLGILWDTNNVEAGHTLTFEIYPDEATANELTNKPACACPPGLTGKHYLGCQIGDAEYRARKEKP